MRHPLDRPVASEQKEFLGADAAAVVSAGHGSDTPATARHTKSPWRIERHAPTRGVYVTASDSYQSVVCEIRQYAEESQAEYFANAHLIAAAPELLELARQVAEHFADTDAPLGAAARAVITKAERS